MSSTELAVNFFIAAQTEEKLKRDQAALTSEMAKHQANKIHHQVGEKVREAIASIEVTMPENSPILEKSALNIAKEQAKIETAKNDKPLSPIKSAITGECT